MTRTARVTDALRGKTLVYLGAGLALAGAGVAAATAGFSAAPATAASARYDSAAHATADGATARQHGPAGHRAVQAAEDAGHASAVHLSHHSTHRAHHAQNEGWGAVSRILAARTTPRAGHGPLPAADRLIPAGISGPQSWMPITTARYANARTIVRQAIAKEMGLRSAVIGVATAMQESTLLNLSYGGLDSLGLFQQRPSAGWGTPQQILHPKYAADAFLNALRTYQAGNPRWAHQPLWQAAQGVQVSAFPYAYAKWEAQAASLVAKVAKRLV